MNWYRKGKFWGGSSDGGMYESEGDGGTTNLSQLLTNWGSFGSTSFRDFTSWKRPKVITQQKDSAKTNLKKIIIPRPSVFVKQGIDPVEGVNLVRGLMDHETAHLRYTDDELITDQDEEFVAKVINMLEDVRVENRMMDDLPGSQTHLKFLFDKYFSVDKSGDAIRSIKDDKIQAATALMLLLKKQNIERKSSGSDWLAETWPEWCDELGVNHKTLPVEKLAKRIEALFSDKSTSKDARKLAHDILDLVDNYTPPPPQPSSSGEGEGEEGEGDGQGGGCGAQSEDSPDGQDQKDQPDGAKQDEGDGGGPKPKSGEDKPQPSQPQSQQPKPTQGQGTPKPQKPMKQEKSDEWRKEAGVGIPAMDALLPDVEVMKQLEECFKAEHEIREKTEPPNVKKLAKMLEFFTLGKRDRGLTPCRMSDKWKQELKNQDTFGPILRAATGVTPQNIEAKTKALISAIKGGAKLHSHYRAYALVAAQDLLNRIQALKMHQHKLIQPFIEAETAKIKPRQLSGRIGRNIVRAEMDCMDVFEKVGMSHAPSTEILILMDESGSTNPMHGEYYRQALAMWAVLSQLPRTTVKVVGWADVCMYHWKGGDSLSGDQTTGFMDERDPETMVMFGMCGYLGQHVVDKVPPGYFNAKGGGTEIFPAMAQGIKYLSTKSTATKKIMIVMTDGDTGINEGTRNPDISGGATIDAVGSGIAAVGPNAMTLFDHCEMLDLKIPGYIAKSGKRDDHVALAARMLKTAREAFGIQAITLMVVENFKEEQHAAQAGWKQFIKDRKKLLGMDNFVLSGPNFGKKAMAFVVEQLNDALKAEAGS